MLINSEPGSPSSNLSTGSTIFVCGEKERSKRREWGPDRERIATRSKGAGLSYEFETSREYCNREPTS